MKIYLHLKAFGPKKVVVENLDSAVQLDSEEDDLDHTTNDDDAMNDINYERAEEDAFSRKRSTGWCVRAI
jgi:hypothetical protein